MGKSLKYTININLDNISDEMKKDIIQDLDDIVDTICVVRKMEFDYVITSQEVEE